MGLISWIIIGGLSGWIAGKLMGKEKMGFVVNIAVGIIGAFIGGFIVSLLGGTGVSGFNPWSLFVSVIGAIILLWLVNLLKK